MEGKSLAMKVKKKKLLHNFVLFRLNYWKSCKDLYITESKIPHCGVINSFYDFKEDLDSHLSYFALNLFYGW